MISPMATAFALAQILLLSSFTLAQQFVGTPIPNQMPSVPGSNYTYFNVRDAQGNNLTFQNYMSYGSNGVYADPKNIKRLVITIHGLNRDPGTYMAQTLSALAQVTERPDVNVDTVAVVTPYFPNGNDKYIGYPWTDGLRAGRGSTSNALVWRGADFASGNNNQYPWNATTISSYEALDQMIRYFDDKSIYPNLKQIVVAGHSLGAQMTQRYAAVGNILNTQSKVSYWIGNPNSLVWFSLDRPLDATSCPEYDNWRAGFSAYTNPYGANIVTQGREAVLARYNSRQIAYGRGTLDFGDTSTGCEEYSTVRQPASYVEFEAYRIFRVLTVTSASSTSSMLSHLHSQVLSTTS